MSPDNTKLKEWADKSGVSIEQLTENYNRINASLPSSVPDAQKEKRTFQLLRSELTTSMRSPAVMFHGAVVGADEPRDIMVAIKAKIVEEYQADPEGVLSSGKARLDGEELVILDARKEYSSGNPNSNFGKPQPEHLWVRRAIAVIKTEDGYKPAKLTLRGDVAKSNLSLGTFCDFRALGEANDDGLYDLRSSSATAFTPGGEEGAEDLHTAISEAFTANFKPLGELTVDFHRSEMQGDYEAFVVTEGTVEFIKKIESEKAFSDLLILNDETLPLDADAITCWIPQTMRETIDFGKGSIVTVICRTSVGKGYDREKKEQTDEDRVMLNVLGIFAVPGLSTPADESDLIA